MKNLYESIFDVVDNIGNEHKDFYVIENLFKAKNTQDLKKCIEEISEKADRCTKVLYGERHKEEAMPKNIPNLYVCTCINPYFCVYIGINDYKYSCICLHGLAGNKLSTNIVSSIRNRIKPGSMVYEMPAVFIKEFIKFIKKHHSDLGKYVIPN